MLRKILFFVSIYFSPSIFAIDIEQHQVIAVEYPPFTSSTDELGGLAFKYLAQWQSKHFITAPLTPLFLPPARAQLAVKSDSWCWSFYPPVDDLHQVRFIQLSQFNVKLGFYRIKQIKPFTYESLSELKGARVAVLRAASVGELHSNLLNAGLLLQYVETVEQGLNLLLHKRVDLAYGDNLSINDMPFSAEQRKLLQFNHTPLSETPVGVYFNSQCRGLFQGLPEV